jgi:hypothetical protein
MKQKPACFGGRGGDGCSMKISEMADRSAIIE